MAKKQPKNQPLTNLPYGHDAPQIAGERDLGGEPKLYATSTWAGMPKYDCKLCGFDSLSLEGIEAHIAANHTPKLAEPKPSGIVIADKNYRVLQEPARPDTRLVGVYELDEEEIKQWQEQP